jgi:hypothetical protein
MKSTVISALLFALFFISLAGCTTTTPANENIANSQNSLCSSAEDEQLRNKVDINMNPILTLFQPIYTYTPKAANLSKEAVRIEFNEMVAKHQQFEKQIVELMGQIQAVQKQITCPQTIVLANERLGKLKSLSIQHKDALKEQEAELKKVLAKLALLKEITPYSDSNLRISVVTIDLSSDVRIVLAIGNKRENNILRTNAFRYEEVKNRMGGVDPVLIPIGIKLNDNFSNTYDIQEIKRLPRELEPHMEYLIEMRFHRTIVPKANSLFLQVESGVFANSKAFNMNLPIDSLLVR